MNKAKQKGGIRMLKKLVATLALTSLAFGSGLCFNPYNHDYGVSTKQFQDVGNLGDYNKTIIFHNGKMQLGKGAWINLVKYAVNGNKAIMLIRGEGRHFEDQYFIVYTECINRKPITKDVEQTIFMNYTPSCRIANLPKYPIKLGFYKDGFWVKGLIISWGKHMFSDQGVVERSCDYETEYFQYKLIKENKGYKGPYKNQFLPTRVCKVLAHKIGL